MSESLRGHFLISGKRLRDPNFFKTVVLIVEHGSDGAMGLVVNRPSSVSVSHALSGHFDLPETEELVYVGGPVEPANLFILHNAEDMNGDETAVVPGLYVGTSAEIFETIVRSVVEENHDLKFRIFSGCAGWGAEQLEGEIGRGDWLLLSACAGSIFHDDPYQVWDEALRLFHDNNRFVPQPPASPEWN